MCQIIVSIVAPEYPFDSFWLFFFPQVLYVKFAKQKNTCLIGIATFVILTEMNVAIAY